MTLILNNNDVRRVLTMKACIDILEDAYREQAEGKSEFSDRLGARSASQS
jgi:ornithine cyclodeaminase/alanine dehydrogenase-like protein (mu-crystallin family)